MKYKVGETVLAIIELNTGGKYYFPNVTTSNSSTSLKLKINIIGIDKRGYYLFLVKKENFYNLMKLSEDLIQRFNFDSNYLNEPCWWLHENYILPYKECQKCSNKKDLK